MKRPPRETCLLSLRMLQIFNAVTQLSRKPRTLNSLHYGKGERNNPACSYYHGDSKLSYRSIPRTRLSYSRNTRFYTRTCLSAIMQNANVKIIIPSLKGSIYRPHHQSLPGNQHPAAETRDIRPGDQTVNTAERNRVEPGIPRGSISLCSPSTVT